MYLRSPGLPQGSAISIQAAKGMEYDVASTPLTFSVNTKVRAEPLRRVKARISADHSIIESAAPSRQEGDGVASTSKGVATDHEDDASLQVETDDIAVAVTGRENRQSTTSGHARRRSGATGSGSHASLKSQQIQNA